MLSFKSVFVVAAVLASQASCAIIKVLAQSAYDKPDPFEFSPNEITARVGDILEFHFGSPGKGVLSGNHSVAQGNFADPCNPLPNGFFSGYVAANATVVEADVVWQIPITSNEPIVFYCTMGQHCSRGMHGVVNGAGSRTLQSYRASITQYKNAGVPQRISGGEFLPNNISNILPSRNGAAGSLHASLATVAATLGLAMLFL